MIPSLFSSQSHFKFALSTFSSVNCGRNCLKEGNLKTGLKCIPATAAIVSGSLLWITEKISGIALASWNYYANKPLTFHLPSLVELEKLSVKQLHTIWKINNVILTNFIEKHKIPRFGFHGTSKEGLEGILKDRASKEDLWVAGYQNQLEPLVFLGDLYTIAYKANFYRKQEGGIFFINTEKAKFCNKFIHAYTNPFTPFDEDNESEKKFISFIYRNKDEDGELSPADEMRVTVDPKNYDEQVLGFVSDNQRTYPHKAIEAIKTPDKYELAMRLSTQELIFKAFQVLSKMPLKV